MTMRIVRRTSSVFAASLLLVWPTWPATAIHAAADEPAADEVAVEGVAVEGVAVEGVAAVLDRVREAVGARRIHDLPGGLEASGRTTVAGVEAVYLLRFAGDGRAVQQLDGAFDMVTASDGDRVWITDLGGESRVADDADSELQRLGLALLTHDWLAADAPMRLHVDSAASTAETIALGFRPVGGRVGGRIEIDRATSLPVRWTYAIDVGDDPASPIDGPSATRVAVSEWVESAGFRVPGRVEVVGDSGSAMTIQIDALRPGERWRDAAAIAADLTMPAQPPSDTTFDAAIAPAIEVVKAPTGHLLVHPLVNGKDVGWFIFDTGAGMNVLTTSVAESLAAEGGATIFGEVPASGVGGTTASRFCRPRSLTLGPATVAEPLTVVLDLSFLDQHMGRKVGGLIGHNFLSRVATELDLEAPAIAIHDPRRFVDEGLAWQPLVISSRLPHVRARFALPPSTEGGEERVHAGLFRLDTGAGQATVSMHEPSVRTLRMLDGLATTDSRAGGVGGYVPMKKATLAWFELGGARHLDLPAEFALEPKGAFADPLAMGNIGGALLRPYRIVLDYPNGRIAFRKR